MPSDELIQAASRALHQRPSRLTVYAKENLKLRTAPARAPLSRYVNNPNSIAFGHRPPLNLAIQIRAQLPVRIATTNYFACGGTGGSRPTGVRASSVPFG